VPATMRDVARQAGVSIKTVSRVVNNQGEISEATRQHVLAVIEELGFRPSQVARALVTRRSHTIGLVMSDITNNPFFPEVARGMLDVARGKGFNVFLCEVFGNPQRELEILHSLADHAVDGIILYPTYHSQDNLSTFADHYRPLISINRFIDHPSISTVMLETTKGTKLAVDYLVGKGHQSIAMLAGNGAPLDEIRRVQGFRQTLTAHGLPVHDEWIIAMSPQLEEGYEAAKSLLNQYPQITAIFAYNDLLALGALQACRELGRRVPEDCAIVGFDDILWAAKATPSLTTVRIDKYDLGCQAAQRLFDMLNAPETVFPPIYIDTELVIRESA
jgi:LacI family transcriptional regulator